MKKVNFKILEDMKKYIPDLNERDYFPTTSHTTAVSVIKQVRKYYNDHLPVDVIAWGRVNQPNILPDKLVLQAQVEFVCKTLGILFECEETQPMVVATHILDGIMFPVYQIELEDFDVTLTISSDTKNWIVSVKSDKELRFDYMELFNPYEKIDLKEYLGIPKRSIYGSYSESKKNFSVKFNSIYRVYMFVFLMMHHLRK